MINFNRELTVRPTPIPGLLLVDLPVHADSRGWFKENWQLEKMKTAGLPDFSPVQHNVSFNDEVGATRGIHAEPWEKYVSVAAGTVFGAWVDLRDGPSFGAVFTAELDPSRAIFVPRGVGNAFQTLTPSTSYTYLANAHYSLGATYTSVNVADETLAIAWPIPLSKARISIKDRAHPKLKFTPSIPPRKILVLGAGGQLGREFRRKYVDSDRVETAQRNDIDIESPHLHSAKDWRDYDTIINAAAYTRVDLAETPEGRKAAWKANVTAVSKLASIATSNRITLVHISSDYVFDGMATTPYREDATFSPLGVYGQTKAAADSIVSTVPQHYIVRTSWVIGEGKNFVATMFNLANRGSNPSVVCDQVGRLTFTADLVNGIEHLLDQRPRFGTYNLTNSGNPMSWAEIAKQVFVAAGHDPSRVSPVSTAQYHEQSSQLVAPRPRNSVLDLGKITATGRCPRGQMEALTQYVQRLNRDM